MIHQVIHPRQHGFVRGRSTVTNLLVYENFISESMMLGCEVDSVCKDFSKAFDRVDHGLLVNKLQRVGFGGVMLKWLASYLYQRSQCVKIKNFVSVKMCVPSGVPQGSHLGPLLFNLFVNDISVCFVNSDFLLFADDLKIYRAVRNVSDTLVLQDDLDRLYDWSIKNKLSLNVSKCTVTFTRYN